MHVAVEGSFAAQLLTSWDHPCGETLVGPGPVPAVAVEAVVVAVLAVVVAVLVVAAVAETASGESEELVGAETQAPAEPGHVWAAWASLVDQPHFLVAAPSSVGYQPAEQ